MVVIVTEGGIFVRQTYVIIDIIKEYHSYEKFFFEKYWTNNPAAINCCYQLDCLTA